MKATPKRRLKKNTRIRPKKKAMRRAVATLYLLNKEMDRYISLHYT